MQFTPGAKAPGALSFWGEKKARLKKCSISYQKSRSFAGAHYKKDITERVGSEPGAMLRVFRMPEKLRRLSLNRKQKCPRDGLLSRMNRGYNKNSAA